jgi:hypothetical protein
MSLILIIAVQARRENIMGLVRFQDATNSFLVDMDTDQEESGS